MVCPDSYTIPTTPETHNNTTSHTTPIHNTHTHNNTTLPPANLGQPSSRVLLKNQLSTGFTAAVSGEKTDDMVERGRAGRVEKGGGDHVILGGNLGNLSIDNFVIRTKRKCNGTDNNTNSIPRATPRRHNFKPNIIPRINSKRKLKPTIGMNLNTITKYFACPPEKSVQNTSPMGHHTQLLKALGTIANISPQQDSLQVQTKPKHKQGNKCL